MLDLNTLKQALAPLSEMGRDEFTFEVEGMTLHLRPLLPLEEVQVQRFASSVLDDIQAQEGLASNDNMSRASAMDYFDRFRIEIIANSIVQVDDLDLRGVKYIATGEVLENGTPVQVPRALAMREIAQGWSRAMITIAFTRYGDLVQKIADQADKIARTTLPDLDAEIERVETRLASLREDRETRAKGDPSITASQITNLVEAGKAMERDADNAVAHAAAQAVVNKERKARETTALNAEKNAISPAPAPPTPQEPIPQPPAPPAPRSTVVPERSPPPTAAPPAPPKGTHVPGEILSSFGDGDDPEAMGVEEGRILEARRLAAMASHASAQEPRDPLHEAVPAGTVGGVEAYRLPSEEMSPRGRSTVPDEPAKAKKEKKAEGTKNPNYKPSR